MVRSLVQKKFRIVRTPLDLPIIIFYGLTLLSTFIAIFNSSLEVVEARRWLRYMTYYLTFIMVTNMVRDRHQLNFLLKSLFLMGTIVAAAMIAQFLLGTSVQILPGHVENLWTQGTTFQEITRINPPGFSIVLVSFIALICILVMKKSRSLGLLEFLQCGLMGMSLLFTFLRSFWAAIIIVFILMLVVFRGKDWRRMVGGGLVVFYIIAIILIIVIMAPGSRAMKLVSASMDRLSTLVKSNTFQGQDSSLNWRLLENRYSFSSIASHPLIGIGMGARYRPFDLRLDNYSDTYDFRRHIHNGYLWILLDMGLLGFLAFMWLSFAFLSRGLRYWRGIANDRMRGIVLGFTLAYLTVLIAAIANSTFTQWSWTPVIGIIMGINEVILRGVGQETPMK